MPSSLLSAVTLSGLLLLSGVNAPVPSDQPADLFNGKTLEGWSHFLADDTPADEVWSVSDGVLICKGVPNGYLFTDNVYQDFRLVLEWRWAPGREPGNSGVLLRIEGKAISFLPKCVEAQLKHESAGDIWAFYGRSVTGDEARLAKVEGHEVLGDFHGVSKMKMAENAPGEWNRYEIEVAGDTLTLHINGQLVNEARGLDILAGPIGLQSEGAEIHFRNIHIEPR